MVDPLQASLKVAAVSRIFIIWANFKIDAFKFSWHIISTSPEKKLGKPCVEIAKSFMMMTSTT